MVDETKVDEEQQDSILFPNRSASVLEPKPKRDPKKALKLIGDGLKEWAFGRRKPGRMGRNPVPPPPPPPRPKSQTNKELVEQIKEIKNLQQKVNDRRNKALKRPIKRNDPRSAASRNIVKMLNDKNKSKLDQLAGIQKSGIDNNGAVNLYHSGDYSFKTKDPQTSYLEAPLPFLVSQVDLNRMLQTVTQAHNMIHERFRGRQGAYELERGLAEIIGNYQVMMKEFEKPRVPRPKRPRAK